LPDVGKVELKKTVRKEEEEKIYIYIYIYIKKMESKVPDSFLK